MEMKGHLEISASASQHQHRHGNWHYKNFASRSFFIFSLPFEVTFDVKASNAESRHFNHMTKNRIFKILNLRRKANRNFHGTFLKNCFRHLELYSNPPGWLASSHCHMGTFWETKDWSSHFWVCQNLEPWQWEPYRIYYGLVTGMWHLKHSSIS